MVMSGRLGVVLVRFVPLGLVPHGDSHPSLMRVQQGGGERTTILDVRRKLGSLFEPPVVVRRAIRGFCAGFVAMGLVGTTTNLTAVGCRWHCVVVGVFRCGGGVSGLRCELCVLSRP